MSTEQWLRLLPYAIAVVVIVVAAILVRRWRLRAGGDEGGASHILDRGWQFYFTPTTLEPPGTVFRIDAERRRYPVTTLLVQPQVGQEAAGEYTESVAANLGILARFLDLKGVNINVGTAKTERLVFKMDNPDREFVDDLNLDKVLRPFLKELEYRVDNRYFVIRECRRATGINHHLTRSQVDNLGGAAAFAERLALEGTLFKAERNGEYLLQQKFEQPMRVMYLPEEIKPVTAGLAQAKPELGRVPVDETLVFEEG